MEICQTLCIKTKATANANTKSTSKGSYNMMQSRNPIQSYFTNEYSEHSEMQHYLLVLKLYQLF